MQLPRIDVGYSAFVAAVVGFLLLGFNYLNGLPVDTAIIGPGAVVIVAFLAGYFAAGTKEVMVTVASAAVVLVQAFISAHQGALVDTALVTTALTAIANVVFVYLLPRIQPTSVGGANFSSR